MNCDQVLAMKNMDLNYKKFNEKNSAETSIDDENYFDKIEENKSKSIENYKQSYYKLSCSVPNLPNESSIILANNKLENQNKSLINKRLNFIKKRNKFDELNIDQKLNYFNLNKEEDLDELNKNAIDFLKNFSSHQNHYHHHDSNYIYKNNENYYYCSSKEQSYSENNLDSLDQELINEKSLVNDNIEIINDVSIKITNNSFNNCDNKIKKNLLDNSIESQNEFINKNISFLKNEENLNIDYSIETISEKESTISDIYEISKKIKRTYLFKILIMGDASTGKTSFVKQFTSNATPRHYMPTIGMEFSMKIIDWDDQKEIRLQLWDVAGEKNFESLSKLYFRDAVGALIFFDCNKESSFQNVVKWKEQLDLNARLSDGTKLPTILIGNKCDLKKDGLCKDQTLIKECCQRFEFADHFFTSAKRNENVKESIICLIQKIFESRMEYYYNQENNIKLDENKEEPKSTFKCLC